MLAQTGVNIFNPLNKSPSASSGQVDDVRAISDDDFLKRSRPALDMLETVRLEKLKAYLARRAIAIPAAVILAPICAYLDYFLLFLQRGDNNAAGITFLVMGALYAWATQPRRAYAKAYKNEILPQIARLFGNFTYNVDGRIDMTRMDPSQIVPHHNRYISEDYFTGE